MKTPIARENVVAVTLSVAAVLVAGILFFEWQQGLKLQQELTKMRSLPVTQVPAQKILPEFKLPNAEAGFPEFLSRSLFAVSRRSSTSAGKGASAMNKGQFVLVGVLITPLQRSALLRDVKTNKTETVALVGVVRGMTLGAVESSRVVLRQGAESEELVLNVQVGAKQPGVPQNRGLSAPAGAPVAPPVQQVMPMSSPQKSQPPGPPEIPASNSDSGVGFPAMVPLEFPKSERPAPVPNAPPQRPIGDFRK